MPYIKTLVETYFSLDLGLFSYQNGISQVGLEYELHRLIPGPSSTTTRPKYPMTINDWSFVTPWDPIWMSMGYRGGIDRLWWWLCLVFHYGLFDTRMHNETFHRSFNLSSKSNTHHFIDRPRFLDALHQDMGGDIFLTGFGHIVPSEWIFRQGISKLVNMSSIVLSQDPIRQ